MPEEKENMFKRSNWLLIVAQCEGRKTVVQEHVSLENVAI